MKALALFSGGLDSLIAIKLIQEQGIEVIPIHFVSYFFGNKQQKIQELASQLNCNVEFIDIKDIHLKIVKSPKFGYGKNFNPCIDCHGLMLAECVNLLPKYNADFVITGEVISQRPKSQMPKALNIVKELSNLDDLLVRPLSAKLMQPSKPEILGWIDRNKLLDIQGRSRKVQMELAQKWNLSYESPDGGCLLTDIIYSKKLQILKKDEYFNSEIIKALKFGRFLRIDKKQYLIIGRNEEENNILETFETNFKIKSYKCSIAGATILGFGNPEHDYTLKVYSVFSKSKGNSKGICLVNNIKTEFPIVETNEIETIRRLINI